MEILNYIHGEFTAPVNGGYLDNIEPATGLVYGRVPASTGEDVHKAVAAAKGAYASWSALQPSDRAQYMERIAALIDEKRQQLAEAESRDNGKPVKLAYSVDIPRASKNMRFYATAIQHYATDAHQTGTEAINYTIRKPLGVVGCISPWNLPLYLFTWKIAPALAAGNTVVAKPSELTPATAFLFSELCAEAGLPPGVLNVVHGAGNSAGQAIVSHPDVKAISFTGGTSTGRNIAATAAPAFKKLSLELGGKNPTIGFADCDF